MLEDQMEMEDEEKALTNQVERCYCIIHKVDKNTSMHAITTHLTGFHTTFENFINKFPGVPSHLDGVHINCLQAYMDEETEALCCHWESEVTMCHGLPLPSSSYLPFVLDLCSHGSLIWQVLVI